MAWRTNNVSVIDTATISVVAKVAVGNGPGVSPFTKRIRLRVVDDAGETQQDC